MLTDEWKKSSLSGSTGGGCVEARLAGHAIEVRDSKAGGAGPVLIFTPGEWVAFLGGARLGEFNLPAMTAGSGA